MHRLPAFLAVAAVAVAAGAVALGVGCSPSSSNGTSTDAGACTPIDSACGQPCDPGNSLGIGRFCNQIMDCQGTKVPTLCATLGDPSEHFCTARCTPADAGADAASGFLTDCGENATCACQNGECGCYPTTCH
jgi:hypothetical protein